jgi:hypothetical protein
VRGLRVRLMVKNADLKTSLKPCSNLVKNARCFDRVWEEERGVSEIRCKDTSNILGFANFFAKKNQKNAK